MKSKQLSRRTVLQAAGVSIALPWLDAKQPLFAANRETAKARMAFIYVPNGVNYAKWLPAQTGGNFELSPTLKVLSNFRHDFSVLSGLCHPRSKGGHSGADTWLTGADLTATPGYDYRNSISIDQFAANTLGLQTRIPSLELSSHGGTGKPGHSQTLSFNAMGIPLPTEKTPQSIFHRLFAKDNIRSLQKRKQRIEEDKSILDAVLQQANALHRKLGKLDQQKLDEYLTSVREVETRVQRTERWMRVPKPNVDASQLPLHFRPNDPDGSQNYFRIMFDLIYLAFLTDTTRVCTFQLAREAHGGFVQGLSTNASHHELSHHGGDKEMLNGLFTIDKFYMEQLGHFLERLSSAAEGSHSLLDQTMIFYGSGMNSGKGGGHSPKDLPLLIAGGKRFGWKLGQHLAFDGRTPLSNLFVTMLQGANINSDRFSDSTSTLSGLT